MSLIDEIKTDELLVEAVARIQRLEAALKRLRDCDWVITHMIAWTPCGLLLGRR
jgi:hypothetical protein